MAIDGEPDCSCRHAADSAQFERDTIAPFSARAPPQPAHYQPPESALEWAAQVASARAPVASAPQVRRYGLARFAMVRGAYLSIRCSLNRRDPHVPRLQVRMHFWCPRGLSRVRVRGCSLCSAPAGPAKCVLAPQGSAVRAWGTRYRVASRCITLSPTDAFGLP